MSEIKVIKNPKKIVEIADGNHIWLNAFQCINPTDEFKLMLANTILEMLNRKDRLLATEDLLKTPVLYLKINKS